MNGLGNRSLANAARVLFLGKHRRRYAGRSNEAKSECPSIAGKPWKRGTDEHRHVVLACNEAGKAALPPGKADHEIPTMKSPGQRALSVFLAVTLAVSMTPSAALADAQAAAGAHAEQASSEAQ